MAHTITKVTTKIGTTTAGTMTSRGGCEPNNSGKGNLWGWWEWSMVAWWYIAITMVLSGRWIMRLQAAVMLFPMACRLVNAACVSELLTSMMPCFCKGHSEPMHCKLRIWACRRQGHHFCLAPSVLGNVIGKPTRYQVFGVATSNRSAQICQPLHGHADALQRRV